MGSVGSVEKKFPGFLMNDEHRTWNTEHESFEELRKMNEQRINQTIIGIIIKRILLITMLVISTASLYGQVDSSEQFSLDFELVSTSYCSDHNRYNSENDTEYSNMIGILKLTNQTDTAISLWIMTCSWTALVKVEPDSILLCVRNCDGNYPTLITVESNKSLSFNSIIDIPSKHFQKSIMGYYDQVPYDTFRIGFMIIKENEYTIYPKNWWDLIKEKSSKNEYIWTESINMEYSIYEWKID